MVVPYIGTWIETPDQAWTVVGKTVVPYIGTWIETKTYNIMQTFSAVVPYIGTWIETDNLQGYDLSYGRTLYRYVD